MERESQGNKERDGETHTWVDCPRFLLLSPPLSTIPVFLPPSYDDGEVIERTDGSISKKYARYACD